MKSTESSILNLVKQSGLAPILIVILIALAVGGYFVYTNYSNLSRVISRDNQTKSTQSGQTTQTPTPTSDSVVDWKTYTNIELAYSIKYPSSWYTYELKDYPYEGYPGVIEGNETIITSFSKFPKFSAGAGTGDQFIGIEIVSVEDIQNRIDRLKSFTYPSGEKDKVVQLLLNGQTAYKVTQLDKDVEWLIPNNNKASGISVRILSLSVESTELNTIDQILSTFRFIQ